MEMALPVILPAVIQSTRMSCYDCDRIRGAPATREGRREQNIRPDQRRGNPLPMTDSHPPDTAEPSPFRARINRIAKLVTHRLLSWLYKVRVNGLEHYAAAGDRVLIVANHTSYLDPIVLWAFLPDDVTFAINTRIAASWWVRPTLKFVRVFPMDPTNPMSIKALTRYLQKDRKAVIFPEGRITVTGALMKIYDGAGLIADKSDAVILPARVDGAQYTPFSRLHGVVRLRWFPRISLNFLPPRKLPVAAETAGRADQRRTAGAVLSDLMCEMIFTTGERYKTLFAAVLDARRVHGGRRQVLEDISRRRISYDRLITQTLAIGKSLDRALDGERTIGILLPSSANTVAVLLALQLRERVPAMLNYSAGPDSVVAACRLSLVHTVVTSRRFLQVAKLEDLGALLEASGVRLVHCEDLASQIGAIAKAKAYFGAMTADTWYRDAPREPDAPAVVLFTSGSEGTPKGVVLSHANLLSNRAQLAARVDFTAQDVVLNALPLFHSFGLTAGTLLPLLSGMVTFLYPSPLHYRVIPEVAYDINATILFGTNTFLAAYAKHAHPYDFYSMHYVFAGAEKLQADTRRLWAEKFGIRILEGYGVTETSPVLAVNTSMHYRQGTVGRLLPGIQYRLEPVPGIERGGRLHVHGPNVMLGYLTEQQPGVVIPPGSVYGDGWHDTGDIVEVDEDGFVTIAGRAKRFAKIAGEMVSLTRVEELAARAWPNVPSAALNAPDPRKGEQIILFTEHRSASRDDLVSRARQDGFGELLIPREIRVLDALPLLATGKVDYQTLQGYLVDGPVA
ncbi:MAG: AMP-binding protein [Methylotetracoccus sp.]